MDKRRAGKPALLALAIATCALGMALGAGSGAAAAKPTAASATARQIKALRRQVASLAKQVAALRAVRAPSSLPPIGVAGGDLSGSYPNPKLGANVVGSREIGNGAVGSSELADNSVLSTKIATNAVGTGEIANAAVGAGDLAANSVRSSAFGSVVAVKSGSTLVNPGQVSSVGVSCPGSSRVLSAGYEWEQPNRDDTALVASTPSLDPNQVGQSWTVTGHVDAGGQANNLFAKALCLL